MDFDDIYKAYAPKIYRVCQAYFNDEDMAKELTQETFIAVWKSMHQFRQEADIGTWIYRIATNKCLRQVANDKKKLLTELPVNLPDDEYREDKEALYDRLQSGINNLPEIDRIIVSLYLEGLPQEKIADITGLSHSNVRVRFHRIKQKLTDKLKHYG